MKSTWRAIVLPFLSVFLVIGITLSFTVELGLWHHPNWSAIGSGASAVAALVASLAVLMAVLGLRKAEKSARINVLSGRGSDGSVQMRKDRSRGREYSWTRCK